MPRRKRERAEALEFLEGTVGHFLAPRASPRRRVRLGWEYLLCGDQAEKEAGARPERGHDFAPLEGQKAGWSPGARELRHRKGEVAERTGQVPLGLAGARGMDWILRQQVWGQ